MSPFLQTEIGPDNACSKMMKSSGHPQERAQNGAADRSTSNAWRITSQFQPLVHRNDL